MRMKYGFSDVVIAKCNPESKFFREIIWCIAAGILIGYKFLEGTMRVKLIKYIQEQYGVEPEHLWEKFPNYIVFRHQGNRKWFGLVMDVSRSKLGLDGDGLVDILNVKLDDPLMVDDLIRQPGYMKGYHISRGNWISILLDGTVSLDEICSLLEVSYLVTAQKKKR